MWTAESLATNFDDAVAIVVDSAESLATNFNDAVAIVVDSAKSLATNFNDARLSSRTQTATIRQETTQTATIHPVYRLFRTPVSDDSSGDD